MVISLFYLVSIVFLIVGFLLYKKTDKSLNFIKWLIISVVSLYGYNVLLGMVIGMLNITLHILLLAIINIILGIVLWIKPITKKEVQKYKLSKLDIVGFIIILAIFAVMFFKDLYIQNGDISHGAIDSAIHYRAAKHYSENLKLFIKTEDKTFFNFNIMQTGAYINDGIFMNAFHSITGLDYPYLYQVFETITLFLSGLAFYSIIIDSIKTKRGLLASLVLFTLYIYGYPYNSWFYGFSYLSVGIMMTTILITLVDSLYEDKLRKRVGIILIVLAGMGLIFSYCLFVPVVFAGICIYCFIKDLLNKEEKKILKIFGKNTLIITGLLLVVTAFGIGYLFVPSFYVEGQTNLVSALKINGAIYSEKYKNFLPYLPFMVMYVFEFVRRIKEKDIRYLDIFAVFVVGYTIALYGGMILGFVAPYYMLKTYFILWLGIFAVVGDLINSTVDKKIIRLSVVILIILYFVMVFKRISIEDISRIYLGILLLFFAVLPEICDGLNFSNWKILPQKLRKKFEFKKMKIAPYMYIIIWGLLLSSWVWIKAGHVIGEQEKHSLPNLVGLYFSENCDFRKLVDLNHNFNKNELKLTEYARENLKDMTVENTELCTMDYYPRVWAVATLEYKSEKGTPYENVIQDTTIYTVEDALKDKDKKYIIKLVSKHQDRLDAYKELIEEVRNNDKIEILYENENGFVAKIIH